MAKKIAPPHGTAPLSPSALIGDEEVLVFVPILERVPSTYRVTDHGLRLFDEEGNSGAILRIPAQAERAIAAGKQFSVIEVDESGPARASTIKRVD